MSEAASADAVLAGLDREQQAAVQAVRGPVCVLAGAGTGKTRTITHRIAYAVAIGAVPPGQLLAVTFTAKAAGEMRARLRALGVSGVQARTFHAAARRQLAYFWPRVVGGELPRLAEKKYPLVAAAAARSGLRPDAATTRDLLAEIEWAKSSLISPDGYAAAVARVARTAPAEPAAVAGAYAAYEEHKRRAGVLDFDDLLLLTAGIIAEHPDVAAQIRGRYRHFVVDEYQDVNPLQAQLLDSWLGGRDDVCVVGDANQTIYSFAGASPSYLLDFRRRFPEATVVRLVRDYRSTPQVVALANRVIAAGRPGPARLQLVAQRPPGPAPVLEEYDDEVAEAAAVGRRCRELIGGGVPASQIAVLFRVNAQSETYEAGLADADVPYQVRGGVRFFDRPEVREAVLLLRGAVLSAPDGVALPATVTAVLAGVGWSPGQPPAGGAARERWESLAALVRLADEQPPMDSSGADELRAFLAELDARAKAQHAPTVDSVTLGSLHSAKGLEWDAVFLVGVVDGTLPISHAVTAEQVDEERRLLYVGITRAREHLQLSWALARSPGGRRSRRPSRFLDGLVGERAGQRGGGSSERRARRGAAGRSACRVCGRTLFAAVERKLGRCEGCPSDVDEALYERLRAWRLDQAGAQHQPAFCVFTDATLTAIAEARPGSLGELAKIGGVGKAKLDRYGADVLALVRGEQVGKCLAPTS